MHWTLHYSLSHRVADTWTHTHMHACMHTHTHICIHSHTHTHAHTRTNTHTHTCTLTHTDAQVLMHTHTHITNVRTHTHMHACLHTHTHTHTHTHAPLLHTCTCHFVPSLFCDAFIFFSLFSFFCHINISSFNCLFINLIFMTSPCFFI